VADYVQLPTTNSNAKVATDTRTIGTDSVEVQRISEIGVTSVATGQIAPTNSAATLLAGRETRRSVVFVNQGSVDVYIGPATVTTGNGFKLVVGASIAVPTTALLQAITASGTGSVHYIEVYE
jgi:hypothetical protein